MICKYSWIDSNIAAICNTYLYLYTKNPNDPCFDWKRPCFGGLTFKNRGHLGSRYIYSSMSSKKTDVNCMFEFTSTCQLH